MTTSKKAFKPAAARILYWLVFWCYSIFVYRSSIMPFNRIPRFFLHFNDKTLHAFFYFVLFWAAFLAFKSSKWPALRTFPVHLSLAYCALMGLLTEISQMNVPGRSCDPKDWASDMLGAAAGLFIYAGFKKRGRKA